MLSKIIKNLIDMNLKKITPNKNKKDCDSVIHCQIYYIYSAPNFVNYYEKKLLLFITSFCC